MLSLKQKMIGLNLYCGGAPAVSPGAAGQGPSEGGGAALWAPTEGAPPLIGGGPRAGSPEALIGGGPRAGPPRALIGPLDAAPRSLIGWRQPPQPPQPPPRPAGLPLPEDELDGCEPDDPAPLVPSPTASDDGDRDAPLAPADPLRAETLEVLLRYLLDVAGADPARAKALDALHHDDDAPAPGLPAPAAPRVARAVQTLRRVGDAVLDKHRLAFQGAQPDPADSPPPTPASSGIPTPPSTATSLRQRPRQAGREGALTHWAA